jgi:hypothetical protein
MLKDKADLLVAHQCLLSRRHTLHRLAIQQVPPGGGAVKATKNIQQGCFSTAGGADDGSHFPGCDVQVYRLQRVYPTPIFFITAAHLFQSNHLCSLPAVFFLLFPKIGIFTRTECKRTA